LTHWSIAYGLMSEHARRSDIAFDASIRRSSTDLRRISRRRVIKSLLGSAGCAAIKPATRRSIAFSRRASADLLIYVKRTGYLSRCRMAYKTTVQWRNVSVSNSLSDQRCAKEGAAGQADAVQRGQLGDSIDRAFSMRWLPSAARSEMVSLHRAASGTMCCSCSIVRWRR
jgi:hypothetical protein